MKKVEKIAYTAAITAIIWFPLINFLRYCHSLAHTGYYNYFKQTYLIYTLLPILFFNYLYAVLKKYFKITYTDILIYILAIAGIISTIVAIDVKTSIFGEVIRYEGLISLFFYYLFFLNVKNIKKEKYKRNIMKSLIAAAVVQTIYSFLQAYTDYAFIQHFDKPHMAFGFLGNPNFYGSYMVMVCLFAVTLFLIRGGDGYFYLSLLFFSGLCLANSTGPFLGFALAFIFLIITFFKRIKFVRLLCITLAFVFLFFFLDKAVVFIQNNIFYTKIEENYNVKEEIVNSVTNISKKEIGNGRLKIWVNSLPLAKEYFWFGCGIDNFAKVYPHPRYRIYDKAHNIYLQMLVTNGIFALSTYCILCLIIFIKGFKLKKPFAIALFMAFVGYSIQAFANISVIDVAPIFYIILGLLYTYIPKKKKVLKIEEK